MRLDELDNCEVVALEQAALPLRSRLYSLAPIGIGTPEVESLTGYISRLAKTHCVKISVLRKEFGEKLGQPHIFFSRFASSNGVAPSAASCVRAVESLTHRSDLRNLTMISWASVVPSNGLLRSCRAWCPDCLREHTTIYEPLIWHIAAVEACLQHRRLLNSRCPFCSEILPVLGWHMWPGQCSKCQNYLGDDSLESASSKAASSYQLWKANAIGEMLAASQDEPFSSGIFREALRLWTRNATAAATARLLDGQGKTVKSWLNGTSLPKLETLVGICHLLETSPLQFLTRALSVSLPKKFSAPCTRAERPKRSNRHLKLDLANIKIELEAVLRNSAGRPRSIIVVARLMGHSTGTLYTYFPELCRAISKRRRGKIDLMKIRHQLEETLRNGADDPPSTNELCRRMGHSSQTIRKYFPELCRAISRMHMEWRAECRIRREQVLIDEVCRVVASLKEIGIEPSKAQVYSRTKKSGGFRNPIVRATLARIQLEKE